MVQTSPLNAMQIQFSLFSLAEVQGLNPLSNPLLKQSIMQFYDSYYIEILQKFWTPVQIANFEVPVPVQIK